MGGVTLPGFVVERLLALLVDITAGFQSDRRLRKSAVPLHNGGVEKSEGRISSVTRG
jgi:hypothetical protein